MDSIRRSFSDASELLNHFISQETSFVNIKIAGELLTECLRNNHKIISCGNGGSMCDAMHFAEELTGLYRDMRPPVPAIAISDPSHITCTANDFGFESIFSRFIEAFGLPGDTLLAISTSGNSGNVINAAKAAKERDMKVIALTGKDGGLLAKSCDVEICAPYSKYSDRTQEIHIKIIHCLIQYIEENLF